MTAHVTVKSHRLDLHDADADMRGLLEYWQARRPGEQSLPTRRDIDVLDLGPWLGRLNLFESISDSELRVRLRGTLLTSFRGHITDGALIRQVRPQSYAETIMRDHRATISAATPTRHLVELDVDGFKYSFCRLTLPLAPGGGLPPMVMVLAQFDPARAHEFWRRYVEAQGELDDRAKAVSNIGPMACLRSLPELK
jgi:PAS domain